MQPSGDVRLPVFVFPNTITFYTDDTSTHRQILTLYNPYEYAVRFKVLCTCSNKYIVADPDGSIRAKHRIDIVVRHTSINLANCKVTDKFRIQMYDFVTKKLIGKSDVQAILVSGEPDRSLPDRDFEMLTAPISTNRPSPQQYSLVNQQPERTLGAREPNLWFLSVVAAVCIGILFMPTEGEESVIAWKVSVNLKLVVSYVLGLVTMAIVRPM